MSVQYPVSLSSSPCVRVPLVSALRLRKTIALSVSLALLSQSALAANFTISADSTTAQTLNAGQTGTVNAGKKLTVGGTTVAVTIGGNNATLTNYGTMMQTGTGRLIRDNTGVTGLTVTNAAGAWMETADADVIQMNKAIGGVKLYNDGTMISRNASKAGSQVIDFNAVDGSVNEVYNRAGALMLAYYADAVRPGKGGLVDNAGTLRSIDATGSSDGIDFQDNTGGGTVVNRAGGLVDGARHGITGGALNASTSFAATITNHATGVIRGNNGAGINFDGFNANQVVAITNHGSIYGYGVTRDGDGVDVDGLVNLTNTGLIQSLNAYSATGLAYSEAVSVGGGTILNSGTIRGSVAPGSTNVVGRGITLVGNDILVNGVESGLREGLYGHAVVVNQRGSLIQGDSDSAIVVGGNPNSYTVRLTNEAGARIVGGGATAPAIVVGNYDTTIVNAGVIDGRSSGKAIQLGAANNQVTIQGGEAQVLGDIDGGVGSQSALTLSPGAGNTFQYDGAISNFDHMLVDSGTVVLSGVSSYTGRTEVSGGWLELHGQDRLSAASALVLSGGNLRLTDVAGLARAQTFASLSLLGDAVIDLGEAGLVFEGLGTVAAGSHLALLNAALHGAVLSFAGDLSHNGDFRTLLSGMTLNGVAVRSSFDGTYTRVAAVPEPSSYALALAGLLCAHLMRRRRSVILSA